MLAFPVLTSPISLDEFYLKHVDEEFYQLPDLFASDWMNEFWNVRRDVQDDFRFVYLGTNCLSINHNWFNATNVKWVWDHLQSQLAAVEASTEDVRDIPGWHEQCQVCLRALAGINFQEFFILLKYILLTRWPNRSICLLLSSTYQSAQCDNDPDELTRLERVIDADLLDCLQSDIDTVRSLLQNPNSWRDGIQDSGVGLFQRKLPQWIRLHDFTSALQIIPLFLKHPVVERLQSISENPLNKYLTVL
ncbi:hypothetical protein AHF37_02874 [Paragonimus kellicotti]|nr:hypothetical protein AHF37_02874 [Paragonimus kellicotti]